ncbi:PepSY-associated TM helix domain-containing protein [Kalamiella sp. sgz302252]|uniref:PepSY-associated TM helix domain-containing protein n=1 Tax=Pantoea sp. sgz302252 TaxID=3341827 RepID=UPI0036D29B9C
MSEKTLAQPLRASTSSSALLPLLRRLHFYIGLFIAPFIFVAALTGTLYVLTPQLENSLYAHQLFTDAVEPAKPLADQIEAAQKFADPGLTISAVRPAPGAGETTRVMFITPSSGPSESLAVFVDPGTLEIRGMLPVYGTSGVLPLRTWLDYLHRNLLLGDLGRNYSELAASWLWVAALGGVLLWATSRPPRRAKGRGQQILRQRTLHSSLGLVLLLGLLFFSATGLTWSRWAGDNISAMRAHFGWMTPAVNTSLLSGKPMLADEHAEHHAAAHHSMPGMKMPDGMTMSGSQHAMAAAAVTPAQFEGVVKAAREAGIRAAKIEIRPTTKADKAWTVSEIDRRWPTRVDSVAVDPANFRVVDKVEFAQFGLLAKLTRWGVDAHMGVLFGLPNQLILAAFGLGLCVMIVLGYRLWWLRRPAAAQGCHPAETLIYSWRRLGLSARFLLLVCTVALAVSLPVMGISLLVLLLIDAIRWQRAKKTVGGQR